MKVFFFFPIWRLEKAEVFLANMEAKGYRLDCSYFRYWFVFRPSKPREVQYVLSYNFVKEHDMLYYEYELRRENQANVVPCCWSGFVTFYRIVDSSADLRFFKLLRAQYLQRVLGYRLLFWLFLALCFAGIALQSSTANNAVLGFLIISILLAAWNILGIFQVKEF